MPLLFGVHALKDFAASVQVCSFVPLSLCRPKFPSGCPRRVVRRRLVLSIYIYIYIYYYYLLLLKGEDLIVYR